MTKEVKGFDKAALVSKCLGKEQTLAVMRDKGSANRMACVRRLLHVFQQYRSCSYRMYSVLLKIDRGKVS